MLTLNALAAISALLGAGPTMDVAAFAPEVCTVLNGAKTETAESRPAGPTRPMSQDSADTLAAIRAMGPGTGGVADPAALALLGGLADMMEEQGDAESQAAAALLRQKAPGLADPTVRAKGRAALGCTKTAPQAAPDAG